MKIKIAITLTDDEYTERSRETQVEIEESIYGSMEIGRNTGVNVGTRSQLRAFCQEDPPF